MWRAKKGGPWERVRSCPSEIKRGGLKEGLVKPWVPSGKCHGEMAGRQGGEGGWRDGGEWHRHAGSKIVESAGG